MLEQNRLPDIREKLAELNPTERERLLAQIRERVQKLPTASGSGSLAPHALSSAQQRLWVLEKFDRVNYLYHVPFVMSLARDIDAARLQLALQAVCNQQPQLTSYFLEAEGQVLQHYATDVPITLQALVLNAALPAVIHIEEEHALADFFLTPFNLQQAPLLRFGLATAPNQCYLLICCHHLIMDAWSAGLFMAHLSRLYHQATANVTTTYQYSDYIAWEQQQLAANSWLQELAYWERQRSDRAWEVDMATDFPRVRHLSGHGQHVVRLLSRSLFNQMRDFAMQLQVSVNHVLLSLFQLVLARYSGQDDVTVGMPVAGRQYKHAQQMMGLFVNTCLHAIKLDYHTTFAQQVVRTKQQLLADLAHSQVPYDYLLKHFYQGKICQQGASFNVLYNFLQTENIHAIGVGNTMVQTHLCLLPMSKFDLSLHAMLSNTDLTLIVEYSTDLFCVDTAEQILQDLLNYTENFLVRSNEPINHILWSLSLT